MGHCSLSSVLVKGSCLFFLGAGLSRVYLEWGQSARL